MSEITPLIDLYALTMAQAAFAQAASGDPIPRAVFDYFVRKAPFGGSYIVFAGLDPLVESLSAFRFDSRDIEYLRANGSFNDAFLGWLAAFRFKGNVEAMREGELGFPNEPLLRMETDLAEAIMVEGLVLNTLNFQSLVATKAARARRAARGAPVLEFGLRRAQGPDGALSASRAAYVGGCDATSNVAAGRVWGIPLAGTMSHAWILASPSEERAFLDFTRSGNGGVTLLVDTYDTIGSGLPAAIAAAKNARASGFLGRFAIRLDSGDLLSLSRQARNALDAAGLGDVGIAATGDLDEFAVDSLVADGAPIDIWGLGTRLVSGWGEPALPGVFKLAAIARGDGPWEPVAKRSDTPGKATLPGVKLTWRCMDSGKRPVGDIIALEGESVAAHACADESLRPLLRSVMRSGVRAVPPEPLSGIRARALEGVFLLEDGIARIAYPEPYPLTLSGGLKALGSLPPDDSDASLAPPVPGQ